LFTLTTDSNSSELLTAFKVILSNFSFVPIHLSPSPIATSSPIASGSGDLEFMGEEVVQ
jgi:hypothetical protein